MTALALHEAVPGHHLQIAIAQELKNLPKFRRDGGYTSFVEGWALYAESLGYETQMYEDLYQLYGALIFEMWRACRLVVDTGIHAKKWTREEAVAYMKKYTANSDLDIKSEVDRYIAWPGQALAYKTGEMKIKELRRKSEEALGSKFDIKEFHDTMLKNGALPLPLLEVEINRWIQAKLGS
jgi:prolyl oligopeptidase